MILQQIDKRNIPNIFSQSKRDWKLRREEIKEMICHEEYGFLPPPPVSTDYEIIDKDDTFCAGNATLTKVLIKLTLGNGNFSFPVYCSIPNHKISPAFVHINFTDAVPDKYMPSEEICDEGFAVISFCYTDITSDDGDFTNGLAGALFPNGERDANSPGKIALWAWAAIRVMDYVQTLDPIDKKNIAVTGHSRLGKTALLAGAFDERFQFVISNNSGCCGAALSRNKVGERIHNICTMFPFWFCGNFKKYMNNESNIPFDQHFLLSLTAPRNLYVSSAQEDEWADPQSEYLSCIAVDEVYKQLGEKGFIHPDRYPHENEILHEGNVGYHIRSGQHYFSRYDWLKFIAFIRKHFK